MPRGKTDNLIKNSDLTPEERKEKASKAGKKSAEVRAKRKLLKDELLALMEVKMNNPFNITEQKTARELMSANLINKAVRGDIDAFKVIRDTIGEKPTERIQMGADEETIAKMDAFFDFLKGKGAS